MTGPGRAVNPFAVPGLGARSARPLCPWQNAEHAHYYVGVDHTQEAFDRFVTEIGEPKELLNYGRIVVTSGPKGCGKSSVINRCASWLQEELKSARIGTHIVDLGGECSVAVNVGRRIGLVHEALVRELVNLKALAPSERLPSDAEGVYAQISDALDPRVVVAVILPPIDVMKELVSYSGLIRRKLVFFAESNSSEAVASHRAQLRQTRQDEPIELSVGPLRAADFWTFVQARLAPRADREPPPYAVTAATMGQLSRNAGNLWSVRRLHAMLVGAYEAKLGEPQSDSELSAQEIEHFGVQMFLREEGHG